MTTLLDIITNALYEMGAYSQGETVSAEDLNFGKSKASRLADTWNAAKLYIYAQNFTQYTMVPNHNPLTIGKGVNVTSVSAAGGLAVYTGSNPYKQGDFVSTANIGTIGGILFDQTSVIVQAATASTFSLAVPVGTVSTTSVIGTAIFAETPSQSFPDIATSAKRPVKIRNANIILNQGTGSSVVRVPLRIVDADWWSNQRVPQVSTTLPTHMYYQASYPNGQMFLWPVPQIAYPIELQTDTQLGDLGINDTFDLPQGYEDAFTYTLAETLCPAFGRQLDATLVQLAQKARSIIMSQNSQPVPLTTTADYGMPGPSTDQRGRADFNWKTGNLAG